ncbi:MAG: RDD family protein [Candidatus Heimdallarchaeota archaeon]
MNDKKMTIKEPIAPLGDRLIAYIIDFFVMQIPILLGGILMLIAWGIAFGIASGVSGTDDEIFIIVFSIAGVLSFLLWMGFDIFYLIFWVPRHEGQSIGKKVKNLRIMVVEDIDTGKIRRMTRSDTGIMLLRLLFTIVDALFFYIVGIYLINSDPNGQRFADQQAKTVVILEEEK